MTDAVEEVGAVNQDRDREAGDRERAALADWCENAIKAGWNINLEHPSTADAAMMQAIANALRAPTGEQVQRTTGAGWGIWKDALWAAINAWYRMERSPSLYTPTQRDTAGERVTKVLRDAMAEADAIARPPSRSPTLSGTERTDAGEREHMDRELLAGMAVVPESRFAIHELAITDVCRALSRVVLALEQRIQAVEKEVVRAHGRLDALEKCVRPDLLLPASAVPAPTKKNEAERIEGERVEGDALTAIQFAVSSGVPFLHYKHRPVGRRMRDLLQCASAITIHLGPATEGGDASEPARESGESSVAGPAPESTGELRRPGANAISTRRLDGTAAPRTSALAPSPAEPRSREQDETWASNAEAIAGFFKHIRHGDVVGGSLLERLRAASDYLNDAAARLRAGPRPSPVQWSEEAVEKVAVWLHDNDQLMHRGRVVIAWDRNAEGVREMFRIQARALLTALGAGSLHAETRP